jgi:DNA-binding transcriptional regulator of glucitol operon
MAPGPTTTTGSTVVVVPESTTSPRRGPLVAVVVVAFVGCLGLGWWQWERFSAAGGTFQNLGYAFQWPLFAVFVIYAYRRFVVLESGAAPEQVREVEPTELPAGLLPERPRTHRDEDDELFDYNTYLARLAAQELDEDLRSTR